MTEPETYRSDHAVTTERIWISFQAAIRGYISRKVSNLSDVEDILQEVFLRIHGGAANIRAADRVQAWVFGVARRTIADHYRKKYRTPQHVSLDDNEERADEGGFLETSISSHSGDHDVHEEVLSWLDPMIAELPEKYAKALRMSDIEGLSQIEIAKRLGLSHSGAKSRVQRARKMLGQELTTCCQVEFGSEGRVVEFRRRDDRCGNTDC